MPSLHNLLKAPVWPLGWAGPGTAVAVLSGHCSRAPHYHYNHRRLLVVVVTTMVGSVADSLILLFGELTHALLKVTNILFSTSTYIHRTLLMCSSDKSSILSQ